MHSVTRLKINSGLTLLELLVSIGIIAIISTQGIGSFSHLIKKSHTVTTTNKILTAIVYARSTEVQRNTTIFACLSNDLINCNKNDTEQLVVFEDVNHDKIIDPNELIHIFYFDTTRGKLTFEVSAGRNYLRFRSNGSAKDYGRIQYCPSNNDPHYASQIIINYSGRPRRARDRDNDGIVEGSDGVNIQC